MEEFKDEYNFGRVEAGCCFVEALGFAKVRENFAARAVIELF